MESHHSISDSSSVRVAVRIRPLLQKEKSEGCEECISTTNTQVFMGDSKSYSYDHVYGPYAQQSDIWECVNPLLDANFEGFNATILAYGQTGSGKA